VGLAGRTRSSHNCTEWISEVARLIPLMGFPDLAVGLSRIQRMPIPGVFTKRGKPKTKPVRVSDGDLPHKVTARFPGALRRYLHTADAYYRAGQIPETRNWVLQKVPGGWLGDAWEVTTVVK
jgi:hypothetical protein